MEILNLNAGPKFTAPSYRIQQANPAVPTLPEWRSASSLTQILQAGFFQTEFQARLVWNAKVSPEYSGAELFLQGPENRLISLNLAAIAQRKDAKPFEIGPLKVIPLGDQSVEVVLRDLTPLSSYQVLLRDVFNNQFTRPTADAQVSDFAGTLPAGVAVVPRQAPHWLGSTETSALRAPVGGFALQDGKESLIFLPRDLTAWLREQEEATRLKALPMAHLYQLPSRVWQESDVWGYHVRINGSEVINIPRADFAKYPAPSEAPEYLMIRHPNPEGLLLEADYQVVYRDGKGPLSFRGFISHIQGAAAEPVPFLVQATPVQGQEYSQILLQFEGVPNAKRYRIFTEGRLLGFAEGLPGQLLSFRAEGLAADTRYEFVVEPERPEDPVTGKAVATTWRSPASGGSSGGGGGGGGGAALANQPSLTALSQATATTGTTLTLTGTHFSPTLAENTVFFGNTSATVTTATATALTVTVPTGIYAAQNVSVRVNNASSNALAFKVKPQITALATPDGVFGGKARLVRGSTLTLTGTGFDSSAAGNNRIRFGTVEVSASALNGNQLTVDVPTSLSLPGDVNMTVTVDVLSSDPVAAILPAITLNANGGFN